MAGKATSKTAASHSKSGESASRNSTAERATTTADRTATQDKAGTATQRAKPANGTIAIRMYRGLLGDFFVIRHKMGAEEFKMLIDCGVLQSIGAAGTKPTTSLGKERIRAGVADLLTNIGAAFDLVVVTHEHYDHLSGYIHARDTLEPLEIGKLWVAWTEDRTDKFANGYREKKKRAAAALAALAESPALAASEEMSERMKTVRDLLQFSGPVGKADSSLGMAASSNDSLRGNVSCADVIEWLKQRAGAKNTSYLRPGEVHKWGAGDTLRAYVLGPPRDDERLRKLDPSGEGKREVYLARDEDIAAICSLAAVHSGLASDSSQGDQPFSLPHRRHYVVKEGGAGACDPVTAADPLVRLYEKIPEDQRIDLEWLGSVETLALKIDGDVNNTSLVLALELPGKEVLLFAADAQVGNWLSWGDQDYPADDSEKPERLSVDQLLARTILYKVGHHASHNATLRERGLELMSDPRLCAMIPLVEKVAAEQTTKSAPKGWQMPYRDLEARLHQRTNGRIVRGDGDTTEEAKAFKDAIFKLGYGPRPHDNDPLWVELTLALMDR